MLRYAGRRLLHLVPLLLGMTFISFLVMQLAPGDYFTRLSLDPQVSAETLAALRRQFGLDASPVIQYLKWLRNLATLNLGVSFVYHIPVATLIRQRLFNTLQLSLATMLLTWLISVPLGILAANRAGRTADRALSAAAFVSISLPSFFLALLALVWAARTGFFPLGGSESIFAAELGPGLRVLDRLWHLALPALVLTAAGFGGLFRVARANYREALSAPFVTALRGRGLPESRVRVHVLRNSLNPLITLLGYELSGLISGVALVEVILAWPGLGQTMLTAVMSQDLYVVMAALFFGGLLLIAGNLAADLLLALNDPRIRLD
ncbi:MAG TPA: ABC transporter permease [bacterium]|uniref:Nickel transport system permease protein NikB n=1 Tax=candidate division TA06 bacterium ADurb.Bin417 TaxID=1852828 RepID=A0A1V5MGM5_UNCT6|nr:MAG: Nickel transport system permease protein NikB [candidate division TA06 bacterium ADurb.Bin417]HNQ35052.1 ABC transporter permease [bacterium]HNS48749.1 ABC transporter permease [bacterium]